MVDVSYDTGLVAVFVAEEEKEDDRLKG